jgi:2-polyprenyl-3-methyl-5-hydroxy-6-metoxy-1,4-benzoquinol methylase
MSVTEIYTSKTVGYFAAARAEMLEFIPLSAKNVLDVGCGDGSFGQQLKARQKCRVTGIEHMAEAASKANTRLDEVIVCDANKLSTIELLPESFDCIVCNDILEHLVDPWSVVAHLATLLAPDGCIVASIPNVRYYKVLRDLVQKRTWTYADKGVLDKTHLRFFTKTTIPGLFEPAGLRVDIIKGINGPRRFPLKYALLNWLSLGNLEDTRYLQYACVVRKQS